MGRQPDWRKRGYETANGRYGKSLMRFNDHGIKRLTEAHPIENYPNGIPAGVINNYPSIWIETDYFQHEVGKDMRNWAEREAEKSDDNTAMNIVFIYGNKEVEWECGYATYIMEILVKKKIKIDN